MKLIGYAAVLVLACLATVNATPVPDCCTIEDRTQVIHGWARTWGVPDAGHRITIAKAVFNEIFKADEKTKELFKGVNVDNVNSGEFQAHAVRVMNGLDVAINLLHDPAALDLHLAHLSAQHKARAGVTSGHFKVMGTVLEKVLGQVASGFNAHAWRNCFHRISEGITASLPA